MCALGVTVCVRAVGCGALSRYRRERRISFSTPTSHSFTWVSCSQAQSKSVLADALIAREVKSIVTAKGVTVEAQHFDTTACTKDDLVNALKLWLEVHPGWNKTAPEQLLSDAGHRIIYTPPYCPELQPIEKLWALVKGRVAAQATVDRTMFQTREQCEDAFEAVTPLQCNSLVRHVHDWIDEFIRSDDDLEFRQFGSLGSVVHNLKLFQLTTATQPPASAVPQSTPSASSVPVRMEISPEPAPSAAAAATACRVLRRRH